MSTPPVSLPALAAWLLRAAAPDEEGPFVVAELEEEYLELHRGAGRAAALRWCWTQVALSVVPLVRRRMQLARAGRRGDVMLATVAGDLRYAARVARRAPVLTLSLALAIAGGIAAATAIVSVMEGVFLRPLPFTQPERLVQLGTVIERFGRTPEMNYLDANDVRAQAATLEGVAQYDVGPGTLRFDADAAALSATFLSAGRELRAVLDITPVLGRPFSAEDYADGAASVVLLGNRFWHQRFGGDPGVVGRSIAVGAGRALIVGVLPASADRFPAGGADLWTPLSFPASSFLNQRGSIALTAIGRLRDTATIGAARAELATIAARLAAAHPETNKERAFAVDNLQDAMVGPVKPMMLLLAGAIVVLLAIACANIANLLLAHAQGRVAEFALRAAIGASRGRLVRQLWTETLALFAGSGAMGIVFARPLARALVARYPDALPLAADIAIDGRVIAIACLVILAAALMAGLPVARGAGRWSNGAALAGGSRTTADRRDRRTTRLVIAAQVALSIVLVFAGLVFMQTFVSVTRMEPGFDARHVVSIRAAVPAAERADSTRMLDVQDALRDAAGALPGVAGAAHAMFIPFTAGAWGDGYRRTGTSDELGPRGPFAHFFMVSPEYFEVMRLPIRRGRALNAADDERGRRVLVVSETFARQSFPGGDAVGQHIDWNDDRWEIVGIAGDMRHGSLWDPLDRDVYVPRRQVPRGNTWILLRTDRPAAALLPELQRKAQAIDAGMLLSDAASMDDRVRASAAPERFRALVTSTLAGLALMLALVGLHGVVAYAVARRGREIGIRLALGARPSAVRSAVLFDAVRAVAAGAIPGLLCAWWVGRWLDANALVHANLPLGLMAVAIVFVAAAILAAAVPAWRASRVDPLVALRTG